MTNESPLWIEWRPQFARHIRGQYLPRTYDEDGAVPQRWQADCDTCGGHYEGACPTGQVRKWIQRFAIAHLHRDPLDPGKPAT